MLKLHDSLQKKLLDFEPADRKTFRIYACGPTVYHYAHIGNLRTFLVTDLLCRYLKSRGSKVKLVMNITDVGHMLNDADVGEDKLEAAAMKEGKTPKEIADFYEAAFFKDIDAVGIKRAWKYPRATAHIKEMIALMKKLLDSGLAYATEKGDVYYDVLKFEGYGKLSGNTVEALVAGARVEVKEDKRNPADFALWISNPHHVLQWEWEWRDRKFKGYPGWHLECSAIAMKELGETIDLHIGGEDLKFPHHECEIAQSEGATGKPFALHWLHVSFLLVEGEKMSKSKGNFYTLSDLLAKGHSPEAVRYLLLSSHYRTQLNFTFKGLDDAENELRYFRELIANLNNFEKNGPFGSCDDPALAAFPNVCTDIFEKGLDKDLNTSIALSAITQLATAMNKTIAEGNMVGSLAADALGFFEKFDSVMVIGLFKKNDVEIPADVSALAEKRAAARAAKNWKDSDRLRDEIAEKGFVVEDTTEGQKLKKK